MRKMTEIHKEEGSPGKTAKFQNFHLSCAAEKFFPGALNLRKKLAFFGRAHRSLMYFEWKGCGNSEEDQLGHGFGFKGLGFNTSSRA